MHTMIWHKKGALALILLLSVILCACGGEEKAAPALAAAPADTEAAEVEAASLALEVVTPAPTQTPQPTPEPTPTPTPEPTPTPTPRPREVLLQESYGYISAEEDSRYANLMMERETLLLASMKGRSIRLYADTSLAEYEEAENQTTYKRIRELVILENDKGLEGEALYKVVTAFDGRTGYVLQSDTDNSVLVPYTHGSYALMCRPGTPIYKEPCDEKKDKEVLSQLGYGLCRVLGVYEDNFNYCYVLTEDGVYGFVDPDQLQPVSVEEARAYLSLQPLSGGGFSMEEVVSELEGQQGMAAGDMESLLYEALSRRGLYFDPGYYLFFTKELSNNTLYPRFYKDDTYNSLLFKLFNTAGDRVLYEGKPTQWAYVGQIDALQRGDVVFFSDYAVTDKAVQENVEVVFRGKYSGHITGCGLYLGEDRLLAVQSGLLYCVENFSASSLAEDFDSARRISPTVTDYTAYLIEVLLSNIYDRLGTPYNNVHRVGDKTYDCSGIICWSMRSAGIKDKKGQKTMLIDRTASGLSNVDKLYWEKEDKTVTFSLLSKVARNSEDIKKLQRGDIVFLINGGNNKIGHVMFFLGEDTVIHSTTISGIYRGTLVAGFRQALKNKYYLTTRMQVE